MKKKTIMAIVLAFALTVTSIASFDITASASTTQQQLNEVKKQIKALQGEQAGVASELSAVQNQIAGLIAEINLLAADMEVKSGEIEMAEIELEEAIATQEQQYQDMKVRIRYMYENSNTSYLQVMLESDSFGDMLNRFEYINKVYEYDRALLTAYEENTKRIEELKAELEQELADLQVMQGEYEAQAATLDAIELQLEGEVSDYAHQIAQAQEQATALEKKIAEEKAAAAAAAAAKRKGNKYTPATTGTSAATGAQCESVNGNLNPPKKTNVNGADMVAYARQYLGNRYVWGGTDPVNGIDCSGFTQYLMSVYGVSIYRTSYMQATQGQEVSYQYAQPGDLIFYAYSNGTVHHVALYEGNGMIIHAASPSSGIIESAATYQTIYCIKRML